MTLFQNILWGYELTCPAHWAYTSAQGADIFAPRPGQALPDALDTPEAETGQVLVRGEWNWSRQPIEPLWNRHIGMLAGMLGAKEVGLAPWRLGDATGLEAEIVLPKKDNRRLWTGILMRDFRVLHFMVTHSKEVREQFEPLATRLIASLRFPNRVLGIIASPEGLPLPPAYASVDPQSILDDIADPQQWRAYTGSAGASTSSVGALQAFYLRELPIHNWELEEYVPLPGPSDLGFARLQVRKDKLRITLGLMPFGPAESGVASAQANVLFKMTRL